MVRPHLVHSHVSTESILSYLGLAFQQRRETMYLQYPVLFKTIGVFTNRTPSNALLKIMHAKS
jgi:hypothetical protein